MTEDLLAIGDYPQWDIDAMDGMGRLHQLPSAESLESLPAEVRERVRLVALKGPLSAAQMDLLPALEIVASYGVGFDAIDTEAAQARGIRVTNTPDVLNDDVADLAVGMFIAQARRIPQGDHWARSGRWAREGAMPLNRQASRRKAGIMGMGRIGRAIADRLAPMADEIHYHSRSEKETPGWTYHADPVALAKNVDDLFVALVGGPETRNYVSREVIDALGPDGVIVNISRGSTLDEEALIAALEASRIRGAALDVFENEPDIDPRFASLDNVLLQPHQGSGSEETRRAMGQRQRDNLSAHLAGKALISPVV